jgi:hypothetical protein
MKKMVIGFIVMSIVCVFVFNQAKQKVKSKEFAKVGDPKICSLPKMKLSAFTANKNDALLDMIDEKTILEDKTEVSFKAKTCARIEMIYTLSVHPGSSFDKKNIKEAFKSFMALSIFTKNGKAYLHKMDDYLGKGKDLVEKDERITFFCGRADCEFTRDGYEIMFKFTEVRGLKSAKPN